MAPFRGDQRRKINAGSAQLRLNASNALSEEQSLDAVDMAGALPNQPLAFPMGAARIFFLDAWYSDDGDQRAQKCEGIDTVGLHTTGSAVYLHTRRVEHPALNAELGQRARQPEAIVARFITNDDPLILDGCSAQSAHQCANVAAGEPMNAWTVSIGSCNAQYPALLAQFDRGV